jgi:hypothetical protein
VRRLSVCFMGGQEQSQSHCGSAHEVWRGAESNSVGPMVARDCVGQIAIAGGACSCQENCLECASGVDVYVYHWVIIDQQCFDAAEPCVVPAFRSIRFLA